MVNYIIIKVTEEGTESRTKAGLLRNLIHRFALENQINVADNLIRQDRDVYPDGRSVPYKEARELFYKATGQVPNVK